MAVNNAQGGKQSKKSNIKSDSFLESFRSIGSGSVSSLKNDLLKPGAKDIFDSLSPFTKPQDQNKAGSNENIPENYWENKLRQQRRQFEIAKREERVVFTRQERETQVQVKNLQNEIKNLATATGTLAKEVQIAAMQEEVSPGTYHTNFLLRLLAIVKALKSQVQESSTWLASFNKKTKKQKNYWNQFEKSGSSFSLHHDRAVATQAG